MEQAERGTASRSQNIVHFLPRTTDALVRIITPSLERIDVSSPAIQLMVVTADAESALVVSDAVAALAGRQGIEMTPVTSENRAARMLAGRPAHAIVGPAIELQSLVQRSAIKLDSLRTIVLAWLDDDIAAAPASLAALESLFSEIPKEAARIMIARSATPPVEAIVDSHLRTARRMTAPDTESGPIAQISPAAPSMHYVSVSASSRPASLRRLLDELDPPSAAIVVRDAASEADAVQTVRSLGYRRGDDPIKVARYEAIPASHTLILYDSPVMPSEIAAAGAAGPVQMVALATPRDMIALHEMADLLLPMQLSGPGAAARSRDAMLREELGVILAQGAATREMLALEPLLDRYDGLEIAAAALRLLDAERNRGPAPKQGLRLLAGHTGDAGDRGGDRARSRGPDRGNDRGNDRPRGRDDRPPRNHEFRGPPRGPRNDHGPKKEWAARPPRTGLGRPADGPGPSGERRERDLGRGPRSGAPGRDDRGARDGGRPGGRPSGPPRRPRPSER